jgi:hypothetical protein
MKESLIQTVIEQYLCLMENMGKLVYTKNNSGAVKTQRGGFVRFGKAGSPDFLIFLKDGKCLHLEVKNEKGRQADSQKDFQKKVEALGHRYIIVRSVDEVVKLLQ